MRSAAQEQKKQEPLDPANLEVPDYTFTSDTTILVGQESA